EAHAAAETSFFNFSTFQLFPLAAGWIVCRGVDCLRGCAAVDAEATDADRLDGPSEAAGPDWCVGGADRRPRWTRPCRRTAAGPAAHTSLCGKEARARRAQLR